MNSVKSLTDEELILVMEKNQADIARLLKNDCANITKSHARTVRACEKEIQARVKHNRWANR